MPRIVSLISSATEIVHALDALPWLVGRSHECDYPPAVLDLPACTSPRFAVDGDSREIDRLVRQTRAESISVYQVFDDVLERLQPTHILTQIQCEVCAVSLADVERSIAASLPSRPRIVSLQPYSLPDVWDDIRRVAQSLEIPAKGEDLIADLQVRMNAIVALAQASATRPTIACIEWAEPIMCAGLWMPALVEMAGGQMAEWRTWDELIAADPEVVFYMPCGFDLARAMRETHWLVENPRWNQLRAVRNRRVYAADGNQYFNRPGPRLVESLQILAEILHPDIFEARPGVAWKKLPAA